ncbi:Replication Factor C Subunit 3 [Manis pentadactyla]|nr:Replication Factor C Subunit 3 [Manis pentadactyla]
MPLRSPGNRNLYRMAPKARTGPDIMRDLERGNSFMERIYNLEEELNLRTIHKRHELSLQNECISTLLLQIKKYLKHIGRCVWGRLPILVGQQTPHGLLEVCGRLYELLTHRIPPEIIMKGLLSELLHNCDGQLEGEVAQMAAYYEHRLQLDSKAIYHLEAFVAKFMALYKKLDKKEDGLEGMVF